MPERSPDEITLNTLHEDLTQGFAEMRSGFGDLKATLISGFRSLPSRESSDEMVRLLREANRLNEERFTQLGFQHFEEQQVIHAIAEGQRQLVESQRQLVEAQRLMVEGQGSLSADIKALIARIDGLIRGRDNGEPAA